MVEFFLPSQIHSGLISREWAQSQCLSKAAPLEGLFRLHEETLAGSSKYAFAEVSRYIFPTVRVMKQPWLALVLYMC